MNLPDIPGAPVEWLLFALLAGLAVGGAVAVIAAKDPFVSALSLILNFASLGVLYLMLNQTFVAVAQVLVYAGAVVVLFLFVIAYLGDRRELPEEASRAKWLRPWSVVLGAGMLGILAVTTIVATLPNGAKVADLPEGFGSPQAVGEAFLTTYLLEFEVTSLVLLVAAIGGIVLGLTGRARHDRIRKLMNTRSADQQRRWYEEQQRQAKKAGLRPGDVPTRVGGDHPGSGNGSSAKEPVA